VTTVVPSQPQSSSSAPHCGPLGFGWHCPVTEQLPIANKHREPLPHWSAVVHGEPVVEEHPIATAIATNAKRRKRIA
jgi:hypothetical protein